MSKADQFANRLFQLHQAKEELAELEMAKSLMEQTAALESVEQIQIAMREAKEQRNCAVSIDDWRLWNRYVARLEQEEEVGQHRVQDLSVILSERRKALLSAHQETDKWETLSISYGQLTKVLSSKKEQRESDELALIRFGRR